jgi:hypothetical protein
MFLIFNKRENRGNTNMKKIFCTIIVIAVLLSSVVTAFSSVANQNDMQIEPRSRIILDRNVTVLFNESTERYEVYFRFTESVELGRDSFALWYGDNSTLFYDVSDCPNIIWGDFATDDYVFMYNFYSLEEEYATFQIEEIGVGYTNIIAIFVHDGEIVGDSLAITSGRRGGVGRTGGGERTPPTTTTAPPTATSPTSTHTAPQNTTTRNQLPLSPGNTEPLQTLPLLSTTALNDSAADSSPNDTTNESLLNNTADENPSTGAELPLVVVLVSCAVTTLAFSFKKFKHR